MRFHVRSSVAPALDARCYRLVTRHVIARTCSPWRSSPTRFMRCPGRAYSPCPVGLHWLRAALALHRPVVVALHERAARLHELSLGFRARSDPCSWSTGFPTSRRRSQNPAEHMSESCWGNTGATAGPETADSDQRHPISQTPSDLRFRGSSTMIIRRRMALRRRERRFESCRGRRRAPRSA